MITTKIRKIESHGQARDTTQFVDLTILLTTHENTPKFNSQHIFDFLMKINPQVVFEELPPEQFTHPKQKVLEFGNTGFGQEFSAIKWYFDVSNCAVVPVDIPNRSELYKELFGSDGWNVIDRAVKNLELRSDVTHEEKKELQRTLDVLKKQRTLALEGNLTQINGKEMENIVTLKYELIKIVLVPIFSKFDESQDAAKKIFGFLEWHRLREKHMAEVIQRYCQENDAVQSAVLVVGADHGIFLKKYFSKNPQMYNDSV